MLCRGYDLHIVVLGDTQVKRASSACWRCWFSKWLLNVFSDSHGQGREANVDQGRSSSQKSDECIAASLVRDQDNDQIFVIVMYCTCSNLIVCDQFLQTVAEPSMHLAPF